jgi:hypothetical protein
MDPVAAIAQAAGSLFDTVGEGIKFFGKKIDQSIAAIGFEGLLVNTGQQASSDYINASQQQNKYLYIAGIVLIVLIFVFALKKQSK